MTGAAFLDRDGTIIELVHHLANPTEVRLITGAGDAIAQLNRAGIPVIIVTNQSVIGRGKLTEAGLAEIHTEMARQLQPHGAKTDGIYFCPLAPGIKDPTVIEHPDRKPGPGMLLRAATEHGLDLARSAMVGDTISDMLAGRHAGIGATILVGTGYGAQVAMPNDSIDYAVSSLSESLPIILAQAGRSGDIP